MEKEKDYLNLLKLFVRIVEANKGTPSGDDERMLDAEGLALKFFAHASTAFYVYEGTILPDVGAKFVDSASINVLGRAALETFLVFHHVFIAPESEKEKDFRYMSWLLSGLIERQTYPIQSPRGKEMLSRERQHIDPLRRRLRDNEYFKALTQKQQKGLLEKGRWKLPSWEKIALSARLSQTHAKGFYAYLCSYAHAGNISVLQIRRASTPQSQKSLYAATIGVLIISMANMIQSYCQFFPKSKSAFERDQAGVALVNMWIDIGATPTTEAEVKSDEKGLGA